jgi:hypothetical protein
MDILLPDASSLIPVLQRNAGGRLFKSGSELNAALRTINANGESKDLATNNPKTEIGWR